MEIDLDAAVTFLRTAFEPEDWLAVLLKSSTTGRIVQRIGPVSLVASSRFLEWLRRENTERTNIYVSVNAVKSSQLTRRRRAIHAIRHVFLDVDHSGPEAIEFIGARRDLPEPSYVLSSSPKRHHVFWRVSGFSIERAEGLQRRLARELGADLAATSASQMTRLPGFMNHKYQVAPLVRIEYRCEEGRYPSCEFPASETDTERLAAGTWSASARPSLSAVRRAERYLTAIPPAISGQHGDLRTFQVCCRLIRGFGLSDHDALELIRRWNRACEPPWSERELKTKLSSARRNGRELIGGLLQDRR